MAVFKKDSKLECIKLFLASLRYNDPCFYSLPNDESCGNQELLLALAWLIVELGLENYLISTIQRSFCEFNPNPIILNIANKKQYEEDKENLIKIEQQKLIDQRKIRPKSSQRSSAKEVPKEIILSESEQLNLILLLAGRVKRMFKTITGLYNIRDQLVKKIKQESVGLFKLKTLSLNTLLALMDVDYMTDLTKEVKRINELIYAYLFWKKHSGNFFLWMESVIDGREKRKKNLPSDEQVNEIQSITSKIKECCEQQNDFLKEQYIKEMSTKEVFEKLKSILEGYSTKLNVHVIE